MANSDAGYHAARVLVTRPAGQSSANLCRLLQAAGYHVHSFPLLQLVPLDVQPPSLRTLSRQLDRYRHVIFISGNAVEYGIALMQQDWPHCWPAQVQWYAVGTATATLLRRYNIDAITPGLAMNSEALLALPPLQDVTGHPLLIVKGEGGRDLLARELTRRGALVDEFVCYRRVCPIHPAGTLARRLAEWQIEVILLSSGQGLTHLSTLLTPAETTNVRRISLIVPSERVAQLARAAGYEQVLIAANASDAAMLDALEQWRTAAGPDEQDAGE